MSTGESGPASAVTAGEQLDSDSIQDTVGSTAFLQQQRVNS